MGLQLGKRQPPTRTGRWWHRPAKIAQAGPPSDSRALDAYWSRSAAELLAALHSTPDGLTSAEAQRRLRSTAPNALGAHGQTSALRLLLGQFRSPLLLILVFAAVISAALHEWVDAAVVLVIILGSALLSFVQEYRASSAVEKLRSQVTATATVLRDGSPTTLPTSAVVPGDVALLAAGSLIPADGVVLDANSCFANQAVLTGESFPVEKDSSPSQPGASLAERTNCVFLGSSVRSGTARVLIVHTGAATAFGQIADRLAQRAPETEFERGTRRFGVLLSQIMLALVIVVFALNTLGHKPVVDALLFSIALAVGLSPELLPAIISITLARGAQTMARRGVIVRRLNAIENFGSMDVLCTDKTGTLTAGVVQLDQVLDPLGQPADHVLRLAFLNAALQTGMANPLDDAIVEQARQRGLAAPTTRKLDEIPYDFVRKRVSVLVAEPDQAPQLVAKGAFEPLLALCTGTEIAGAPQPLDAELRAAMEERFVDWSRAGFRVLAVATRELPGQRRAAREDEHDLVFAGFLLFFDPPKPGVATTIAALAELGIQLKIVTGDNVHVAQHIAASVGLAVTGVLRGAELHDLQEPALWHRAQHTNVFAEIEPNQKERIIRALHSMGSVVGYLGDGINDAPALHSADVGISVDTAVDVAKEAADFVLLQHDLAVLRAGVEQGRKTFANTLKYVLTTESANFGNMLSMAGASAFLPFLPLLAKQILLNNFLSDIPGMTIAGDNVDAALVQRPQRWDIRLIRSFMLSFGALSSVFDYLTFGLLLFVVRAVPAEFQTAWFVESLLTELVIALVVRTRLPFWRSRPSRLLLLSTLGVMLVTFALPYTPLSWLLGFTPLPVGLMLLLAAIAALYVAAAELAKRWFYRRWDRITATRRAL